MVHRLFLFVGMVSLLSACSSGKTALHRGHFDLAVKNASHRLNQQPGLSKRGQPMAALVLKQAFIRAYEQHQTAKSADLFPPSRGRLYDSMRDELAGDVARRLQTRYKRD